MYPVPVLYSIIEFFPCPHNMFLYPVSFPVSCRSILSLYTFPVSCPCIPKLPLYPVTVSPTCLLSYSFPCIVQLYHRDLEGFWQGCISFSIGIYNFILIHILLCILSLYMLSLYPVAVSSVGYLRWFSSQGKPSVLEIFVMVRLLAWNISMKCIYIAGFIILSLPSLEHMVGF